MTPNTTPREPYHVDSSRRDLFQQGRTPLEVLTAHTGPLADVPPIHRLLAVLHENVCSERAMRLFACDCADRVIDRERKYGREPSPASVKALRTARAYVMGDATISELKADASHAAVAAPYAPAADAAAYAAAAAVYTTSAPYVAAHAVYASTTAAFCPESSTERQWQVSRLASILAQEPKP